MKLLILHLSDLHIKDSNDIIMINSDAIVNSLKQISNFDKCIIVISGDIVFSGKEKQYNDAYIFINKLLEGIKQTFNISSNIKVFVVPGNHDNLVVNEKRNFNDINHYYESKVYDVKFSEDLKELDNFFNFANKFECFNDNKIIDTKQISLDNINISVNLINTAPFSLLGGNNADKGLHYLPEKEIRKIEKEQSCNVDIAIMHHSPEWFIDSIKNKLNDNIYASTDFLFLGHEHHSINQYNNADNQNINISSGVALYNDNCQLGYNALVFDSNRQTITNTKMIYDGEIYRPDEASIITQEYKLGRKHKFSFNNDYSNELIKDTGRRENNNFIDYFVFPKLEEIHADKNKSIITINSAKELISILDEKSFISIEGSSQSGKSTLAKYLTYILNVKYGYISMLLTNKDFSSKTKNIIKYAIEEQYGTKLDYDKFYQLNASQKILLIDDINSINKTSLKNFLDEYRTQFKSIIAFKNYEINIDFEENIINDLKSKDRIDLNICPFYYEIRQDLVKKAYKFFSGASQEDTIEDYTFKINEQIANDIKFIRLTPDFIVEYVNYYINSTDITIYGNNIFNKVYETNIIYHLQQHAKNDEIEETLLILDYLASYIHFNQEFCISYDVFNKIVKNCNKKYDLNLNAKKILQIITSSSIIKESNENFTIMFSDKNLLSYFVAKNLSRSLNENSPDIHKQIEYILSNISSEPNGTILLFLSYITQNKKIIESILNTIEDFMGRWAEYDFINNNIALLKKDHYLNVDFKIPSEKEKQENVKSKAKTEKRILDQHNESTDIYKKDKFEHNQFEKDVNLALGFLQLISKILPGFRQMLYGEDKNRILDIVYKYPNKLLYLILNKLDKDSQKIITNILNREFITQNGQKVTKEILEESLKRQAIIIILSLYDYIGYNSSLGKGLEEVNKFNYKKSQNYMLQNIMMEKGNGKFNDFASKVENLYNITELNYLKDMLKIVTRIYFLDHNVRISGDAEHLLDVLFQNINKKELLIEQKRKQSQMKKR